MKTLNEVAEIVGMTRRVIQEYEKAGLATTPTTTNKYGNLLYDDQAIERLWQIRFYRELEYDKKQIKEIFSDPSYNKHDALTSQIELLKKKKERLEALIETAKAMNEMGLTPAAVRFGLPGLDDTTYDTLFPMVGAAFKVIQSKDDVEESFVEVLTEEDSDLWFEAVEKIMELCKEGHSVNDAEVQKQVEVMHSITSKELSESILLFSWNNLSFAASTEIAKELDEIYGDGSAEFLFQATRHYCSVNADNPTDRELNEALETIEKLGRKKYTTNSDEVQNEVGKIHAFFSGISAISQSAQIQLLSNVGELFGSKAYKDLIDNGAEKGIAWFISRAIQIYCGRLNQEI